MRDIVLDQDRRAHGWIETREPGADMVVSECGADNDAAMRRTEFQ